MAELSIMTVLMGVISDRKNNPPSQPSYVSNLLRGGVDAIGAKITEEAAEVVEAGDEPGEPGREHLVKEVADLVFHTAVLLALRDLAWSQVEAELRGGLGSAALLRRNRGKSLRSWASVLFWR